MLRRLADVENPASLSNRMRQRRFERFARLAEGLPRPLRILDVGGTEQYWENRGWTSRPDVHVTLVNLSAVPPRHPNISSVAADASDLRQFGDNSFDIAFSNSVIEHLITFENQAAMAREMQRVARAYWVQTPNFWFPMEPHFHVPGWHWMPEIARVALLQRRRCGWRGPCPDVEDARRSVKEVRLLSRRELRTIFPSGDLWGERFLGIVKSWVVTGGFPQSERDI